MFETIQIINGIILLTLAILTGGIIGWGFSRLLSGRKVVILNNYWVILFVILMVAIFSFFISDLPFYSASKTDTNSSIPKGQYAIVLNEGTGNRKKIGVKEKKQVVPKKVYTSKEIPIVNYNGQKMTLGKFLRNIDDNTVLNNKERTISLQRITERKTKIIFTNISYAEPVKSDKFLLIVKDSKK